MRDRGLGTRPSKPLMGLLLGLPLVIFWLAGGCLSSPGDPIVVSRPNRAGVYHTVKRHQTLWRICKTYNVQIKEVARMNGIRDVNRIQTGQRIFIPGADRVLSVDVHIEDFGPSGRESAKVNLAEVKGRFVWPVEGKVIRGFDRTREHRHDGIDISAPEGTAIRSVQPGKVLYSGNEIKGYGNIVIIKHGSVFSSIYAHNAVNLIQEGDHVDKGQVIARVGRTGRAKGAHLHFQIRTHNKPIDPLLVLP